MSSNTASPTKPATASTTPARPTCRARITCIWPRAATPSARTPARYALNICRHGLKWASNIPLDTAKKLGLRISHSHYPPDGVANYTIMLMLMCTRRMNEIMLRANVQDYSLPGKMGRDISGCTVGVIGTGKIGQTVIRHLSGFGCKILAYDLYPNDAVRQYADYVTLDELYAQSDIKTTTSSTPAPLQK